MMPSPSKSFYYSTDFFKRTREEQMRKREMREREMFRAQHNTNPLLREIFKN